MVVLTSLWKPNGIGVKKSKCSKNDISNQNNYAKNQKRGHSVFY